jgi:hypothetical protein
MNILPKIYTLKDEAQTQFYEWFDKEVRPLPKKDNGKIDTMAEGLLDNDVDALRHSFVSGVYVLEFSEQTSEIMGRLNELKDFDSSSSTEGSENMDLWNNAVGRKVAKKVKTWRELYEILLKSMKQGELILNPADKRQYRGSKSIKRMPKSFVIKIKENTTGANIEFLDVHKRHLMNKSEFILAIRQGKYLGYAVRNHTSGEFLYSIRDKFNFNNLG